jgi:molybdate transport system substrate-binding protein
MSNAMAREAPSLCGRLCTYGALRDSGRACDSRCPLVYIGFGRGSVAAGLLGTPSDGFGGQALYKSVHIASSTMDRSSSTRSAGRCIRSALALVVLAASATAAAAADLTVSAAASLANAFKELGPLFEAAHPGTKVLLNFGASGALLQQIVKGGAPVDVFVSADEETMDQAQRQGIVHAAQRRDVVSNTLVVIVPAAAAKSPKAVADLAQPGYERIAIGLPASVPVGRYTKRVLERAGLWSAIEAKMVGANTVRQALDYVARAEVDAGFVYATDAALMPAKVKVALTVPTPTPVRYPAAVIAASSNPQLAAAFVDFLRSTPAQTVLATYGFGGP